MSPSPEPSSRLKSRYTCDCGKGFVHKEHLTRHQATHNTVGYICTVCKRQFSRKDLLRRHSILHEPSHRRSVVSCDACRANKTKCSGGTQCLLCARRGINCTFQNRPKGALANERQTATNASTNEDNNVDRNDLASPAIAKSKNPLTENDGHKEGDTLPPSVKFFQNLTIVPSTPIPTSEVRPQSPGIQAIYELLVAESPSLEGATQDSPDLEEAVTRYLETYFKNFHLRWPILHAPSFDIITASLPLAASVCVIGAFQSSVIWTERFYAFKVHDILLRRLLHNLIESKSLFTKQAWPIELFQAVLLTLAFSLYRTDKNALSKSMLLRSTFVVILRDIGAFNRELFDEHLKTNFTGPYAPYTQSMREAFKRLLGLTYQFDAYFALVHEIPPMLHRQEIAVDLPRTFALWNAHGLDVFAIRQLEEPPGRLRLQICKVIASPDLFKSLKLLVEDIQLGLCGLLQAIWVSAPPFPSTVQVDDSNAPQRDMLIKTLDAWKQQLDLIYESVQERNMTTKASRYLFEAYRGEDDSVAASSERAVTLVQDGMVLYYYLKMYQYTGVHASKIDELLAKETENSFIQAWQNSKDGREALVCASQMLKVVDSIGTSNAALNPLIRHALAVGFTLTKVWVSCQKCECDTIKEPHPTNTNLQRWTEIGGPLWIDGILVCVCRLDLWTARFQKAIQEQRFMME